MVMFTDNRSLQAVRREPTLAELRAKVAEEEEILASWVQRAKDLPVLLAAAQAAQDKHQADVNRIQAQMIAIMTGPQDGVWIDDVGQPHQGVSSDGQARYRQLVRDLQQRQAAHKAWIAERLRAGYSRQGVWRPWSTRSVVDIRNQIGECQRNLANAQWQLDQAKADLARAEERLRA